VVTPEAKQFPLEYWDVVTPAVSDLGAKAEWRLLRDREKVTPVALIVRVRYAAEKSGAAAPKKSRSSPWRRSRPQASVLCGLSNGPQANEHARTGADAAAKQLCLH
jgi:hypothetical protein